MNDKPDYYVPPHLEELVESITYKGAWVFSLRHKIERDGSGGLIFQIVSYTDNSYDPTEKICVAHNFLVPPASYNRENWIAWLFDRIRDVETHEAGEFFMIDGYRVFAPHHGNGEDPYRVWLVGDHEAARKKSGQD